jgi:hypothetical protein
MAIEIFNSGSSLKITNGSLIRHLMKSHIKEVSIVRSTILWISVGNSLKDIYLDQLNVENPASTSPANLRDQILAMLEDQVVSAVGDVESQITQINSKQFYEPDIIDSTTEGVTFKGFSNGNRWPDQPEWVIQKVEVAAGITRVLWAEGVKDFNKVWNSRTEYMYM